MRLHLGYILGLFAIALASAAGYISVVGWGKLFAGEATIVMIVMAVIESAKVVTTIYLHRYGKKTIPKKEGSGFFHFFKRLFSLKTYLVIGVMATMFLTSVGIYGFLTGAYQETANKMELQTGEVSILEGKRDIFKQKIEDNNEVKNDKSTMIDKLIDQRQNLQVQLDSLLANEHWKNAKETRIAIETTNEEIKKLTEDIDVIIDKNSALQDSVSTYQVSILELNSTSDVAAEIGPLKYISSLTGRPMNSIINWIVLVIIFIFDPMAISLVLASNKVFDLNARSDTSDDDPPSPPDNGPEPISPKNFSPNNDDEMFDLDPEIGHALNEFSKVSGSDKPTKDRFPTNEVVDIPEPTETYDEPEDEGDDSPIDDELNPITEEVKEELEKTAEEINLPIVENPIINNLNNSKEPKSNSGLDDALKNKIEMLKKHNTLEEQLVENKEEIEKLTDKEEIKREEIKEIKQQKRPYSVNVPKPKNTIQRIGTNKIVKEGEENTFYFDRPKQ